MCGLQEGITACTVVLWDGYSGGLACLADGDIWGRKCLKYRVAEISLALVFVFFHQDMKLWIYNVYKEE